jgi:hypothetical protein
MDDDLIAAHGDCDKLMPYPAPAGAGGLGPHPEGDEPQAYRRKLPPPDRAHPRRPPRPRVVEATSSWASPARREADFQATLDLVEEVGYASAYLLQVCRKNRPGDTPREQSDRLAAGGDEPDTSDVDGALRMAVAADDQLSLPTITAPAKLAAAQISTRKKTVFARTPNQDAYIRALDRSELVFGVGPAGTGKTYLAVAHAAMLLERGAWNGSSCLVPPSRRANGWASCRAT